MFVVHKYTLTLSLWYTLVGLWSLSLSSHSCVVMVMRVLIRYLGQVPSQRRDEVNNMR